MQTSPILSSTFQAREPSSVLPPALPPDYTFLSKLPTQHRVNIKHPGYGAKDEDLFSLYAWDHADGGLHLGFVLDACSMISGHQPGGYLSTTRGGPPILGDVCALLRAGNYYFHIPTPGDDGKVATSPAPYRWPVVACFRDWSFPKSLPSRWAENYLAENVSFTCQQSTVTGAVRGRDRTCRVSDHSAGTQRAHLVPQHEADWFKQNSMSIFNIDLTLDSDHLLDDLGNSTLLRSDLHTVFDERKFIFYPKTENCFVVHMLEPTPDLAQLYHNVPVQSPFSCHANFLYARMAWAIFPSLAGFWSKPGVKRTVLMYKDTANGRELVEEEIMNTADFQAKIASRSRSPMKRPRARDHSQDTDCRAEKQSRALSYIGAAQEHVSLSAASQKPQCQTRRPEGDHTISDDRVLSEPLKDLAIPSEEHVLSRFSPEAIQLCPSWYRGHREVDKMKGDWLQQERKRNAITAG